MRKIVVSDYTERNLAASRTTKLLFREKTALAAALERIGVDVIELPTPQMNREDAVIAATIAKAAADVVVAIPVPDGKDGAARAWDCVREAAHPRLQVILPTATATMEYEYHKKEAAMLDLIGTSCRAARELCPDVEFVARDASRASEAFLKEVCRCAVEAGASILTLSDDAGCDLPRDAAARCKLIKEETGAAVYAGVSDARHLGTACALAALEAGADGVKTALGGSGALPAGHLATALRDLEETVGVCTGLAYHEISSEISGMLKALRRGDANAEDESDTAKESLLLDAGTSPEDTAAAAARLGYELTPQDIGAVTEEVRRVCSRKSSIGREEFEAIIAAVAMQVPPTYQLDSFLTTSSNLTSSVSSVTLLCGEETLEGTASGDGPIDSVFKAIEQSIGHHYELDDFQISSVTEGKEALGSAVVRLRFGGVIYSGNGVSSDIVGAGIRAYLNALNKIIYFERNSAE